MSLVQENLDALMYIKLNGPSQSIFENHFLTAVLHTWLDTQAGRQVSIGQHLDKSIYNSLDSKVQHMIRTGTSHLQLDRKKQAMTTVVESRGKPMVWSCGKGRFGNLGENKRKSQVYAAGESSKKKKNCLYPNLAVQKSVSYLSIFAENPASTEEDEESDEDSKEEEEEDEGEDDDEEEEEDIELSEEELDEQALENLLSSGDEELVDEARIVGEADEDEVDRQDGAWRDKAASSRKAEEASKGITYPLSRSGRTQRQKADNYSNDHLYESYTKRCATNGRL